MKVQHGLIAVALVGGVALLLVEQNRHRTEIEQVRGTVASLAAAQESERTGGALEQRARPPVAPERPSTMPPTPATREEAPLEEPPEAEPRPAPLEASEVRDQLDVRFIDEWADPEWTASAQRTAQSRLADVLPPTSSLRSVECRASMCRFETTHESLENYQRFVQDAFLSPETKLWNGGFFSTELTDPVDGRLVIVSYLARDGEDLEPVQQLQ